MIAIACSGPGAGQEIAGNIEIANYHAGFAVALVLASLALFSTYPRQWIVPAMLIGLLAFHPAWTVSAISGDCGLLKRCASQFFTGFGALALTAQAVYRLKTGRKMNASHE